MSSHSFYISDNEFERIRFRLVDNDILVVKLAIQELIAKFEQSKTLNILSKKTLCSIECALLKRKSSNLRKWVYHLAFYCYNLHVLKIVYQNLVTGFEDNLENITWGLAILSKNPQFNIEELYNKFLADRLSYIQFKLCTVGFSNTPMSQIDKDDVYCVLDSEDSLSKIWLTKLFVCPIRKISFINLNTMNSMLDDCSVTRYALWAMSTEKELNVTEINLNFKKAATLDDRSLGWYYICLFKDYNFIKKNQDLVQSIFNSFSYSPEIVQIGILKGILYGNYESFDDIEILVYYLLNCFSSIENVEENHPVISLFVAIFLLYSDRSDDIECFLRDIYNNSELSFIKKMLINILGERYMGKYEFEATNVQIIENANAVNQFNNSESSIDENLTAIEGLKNQINNNDFDRTFDNDDYIQAIIAGIEAQLNKLNYEQKQNKDVKKFIKAFEKFKTKSNATEKKKTFLDFLSVLSNLCTIANTIPNLVFFTQSMVSFLQSFFN